ncbi:hypothetical protein PLESTM_001723900, partial [Pleodorina starrii]
SASASLLCPDSESSEELAADAAVILSDLALNPRRRVSWGALQALYTDAFRRLLNEASLYLEPGALGPEQQQQQGQQQGQQQQGQGQQQQPHPHGGLAAQARAQLARLWGLAVRSAAAAAHLDPDPESRAIRLEQIAVLYYDMVVPCHPLYDTLRLGSAADAVPAVDAADADASGALAVLSPAAEPPPEAVLHAIAAASDGDGCSTSSYMTQVRRDWRYQAACLVAGDMWSRTAAVLSDEWQYEYFQGLLQARRKAPGWRLRCLDHLAAAAALSTADPQLYDSGGSGLLAPLVALHGRRVLWLAKAEAQRRRRRHERGLRRLEPGEGEGGGGGHAAAEGEGGEGEEELLRTELLQICARYCFQRSLALRLHPDGDARSPVRGLGPHLAAAATAAAEAGAEAAAAAPAQSRRGSDGDDAEAVVQDTDAAAAPATWTLDELTELLLDDARQALLFAVRSYKTGKEHQHYHPGRYILARCELLLGRPDDADSQLRPLFTPCRGRAAFSLNVSRVSGQLLRRQKQKQQKRKQQQQQQQQQGKAPAG